MDVSAPCLENKLSKVSEQSGESHGAAAAAAQKECEEMAVNDSEETLCPRE